MGQKTSKRTNMLMSRIDGDTESLNLRKVPLLPLEWHVIKIFLEIK